MRWGTTSGVCREETGSFHFRATEFRPKSRKRTIGQPPQGNLIDQTDRLGGAGGPCERGVCPATEQPADCPAPPANLRRDLRSPNSRNKALGRNKSWEAARAVPGGEASGLGRAVSEITQGRPPAPVPLATSVRTRRRSGRKAGRGAGPWGLLPGSLRSDQKSLAQSARGRQRSLAGFALRFPAAPG